jgi:ABC-type nitrate/sulfonate/bicarbonate transport system substrate-binding protein
MKRIVPILLLALAMLRTEPSQAADLSLDIPFQSVGVGVLPFWVGVETGSFKKYGIDATTEFVAQSPTVIASMLSGDMPFAISGEDAVISADLAGGDIVILASGPEKLFFSIYAATGIKTVADLKDKRVGISKVGATTDFVLRYVLGRAGLAANDVIALSLGTTANNLAAMEGGMIDATVLAPPTTLKLKQLGFNEVANMATYDLYFYTSSLDAKKSWVAAHRDETLNVVRGYIAGIAATYNDKQAAMTVLAKYSQTNDAAVLEDSYDTLLKVLPKVPLPKQAAIQSGLDQSKNPAAKSAKAADFTDPSFVEALQRDSFIDSLYK